MTDPLPLEPDEIKNTEIDSIELSIMVANLNDLRKQCMSLDFNMVGIVVPSFLGLMGIMLWNALQNHLVFVAIPFVTTIYGLYIVYLRGVRFAYRAGCHAIAEHIFTKTGSMPFEASNVMPTIEGASLKFGFPFYSVTGLIFFLLHLYSSYVGFNHIILQNYHHKAMAYLHLPNYALASLYYATALLMLCIICVKSYSLARFSNVCKITKITHSS